nr:carboxypeptidase-like regulatory domain-containing protein [Dehalococcoidia bacterium]
MNQSRLVSSLFLTGFLVSGLSAQDAVLSGRITDATSGDPLPGANVVVENTNYGGATDVDGNYSFSVPASGQEVDVTARFIGYFSSSESVTLSAGTVTQDFALAEDVLEMEAIIVTGLVDATPKIKSPLSTGQITGETLERVPGSSPASALYGKVAGVKVVQGGGQPGDSPSVLLRGPTSINASGRSQDPLYIVDGVVVDPSVSGSPLGDIPGDEIASIEVVKGAAGASMYGARAANGVIQITTKRGNGLAQNQTKVKFRSEYGTNDLPKTLEPNMSHAYLQNSSGDFIDGNGDVVDPRATSGRQSDVWNETPGIEFYDNAYKWVSTGEEGGAKVALPGGKGYNQMRRFFKENDEVNQTLTVSRNMESTNFSVSLGNLDKEGILSDIGGYGRQNVRVNVDHKFRNNLNIGFTTMVSQSERDAVSSTFGGFYAITFMAPDADLTMTDPATAGLEQGPRVYIRPDPASVEENPLYFLKYNDRDNTNRRVMSSFSIRYNPVDWAHITGSLSYDRANQNYDSFYPIGYTNISGGGTAIDGRYLKTTSADLGVNGDLKFMATREFGDLTAKVTGSTMF